jgi:uncharacterized repeat protein (TIGR02543 family)
MLVLALVASCFVAVFATAAIAAAPMPPIAPVLPKVNEELAKYDNYRSFEPTGLSISGNDHAIGLWWCTNNDEDTGYVYLLVTNTHSGADVRFAHIDSNAGTKVWSENVGDVLYALVKFPNMAPITGNEYLDAAMGNGNGHLIQGYIKQFFIFETYRVEYYYDGLIDESKTTKSSVEVKVGTVIETYVPQPKTGYIWASDTTPLEITAIADNNVIRVYYVKDSFTYVVKYYKDGALFETGTPITATYLDVISTYAAPAGDLTGYKWDSYDGPLTISAVSADNVLNVYYVKDSFGYAVRYYKISVDEVNFLNSVTGTGVFDSEIDADLTLYATTGYITPGVRSGATVITAVEADNVVYVVYSLLPYQIEFLLGNPIMGDSLDGDTSFTVYYDDAMPTPPHPYAKFGYKFTGWKGSDGSFIVAPDYKNPTALIGYPETVTGSVTYTAQWALIDPKQTFPDKIPSEQHFDQWWADYGILCVSSSTTANGNYEVYFADWFFEVYRSCKISFGSNTNKFDFEIEFTKNDATAYKYENGKRVSAPEISIPAPGHYDVVKDGMHYTKQKQFHYGNLLGFQFVNPFGSGAKLAWYW